MMRQHTTNCSSRIQGNRFGSFAAYVTGAAALLGNLPPAYASSLDYPAVQAVSIPTNKFAALWKSDSPGKALQALDNLIEQVNTTTVQTVTPNSADQVVNDLIQAFEKLKATAGSEVEIRTLLASDFDAYVKSVEEFQIVFKNCVERRAGVGALQEVGRGKFQFDSSAVNKAQLPDQPKTDTVSFIAINGTKVLDTSVSVDVTPVDAEIWLAANTWGKGTLVHRWQFVEPSKKEGYVKIYLVESLSIGSGSDAVEVWRKVFTVQDFERILRDGILAGTGAFIPCQSSMSQSWPAQEILNFWNGNFKPFTEQLLTRFDEGIPETRATIDKMKRKKEDTSRAQKHLEFQIARRAEIAKDPYHGPSLREIFAAHGVVKPNEGAIATIKKRNLAFSQQSGTDISRALFGGGEFIEPELRIAADRIATTWRRLGCDLLFAFGGGRKFLDQLPDGQLFAKAGEDSNTPVSIAVVAERYEKARQMMLVKRTELLDLDVADSFPGIIEDGLNKLKSAKAKLQQQGSK